MLRSGEFQVTVCGVTVCPFSRHKGDQRPKCLLNKAQLHLPRNCPFSSKTNLHLELPGRWSFRLRGKSTQKSAIKIHAELQVKDAANIFIGLLAGRRDLNIWQLAFNGGPFRKAL